MVKTKVEVPFKGGEIGDYSCKKWNSIPGYPWSETQSQDLRILGFEDDANKDHLSGAAFSMFNMFHGTESLNCEGPKIEKVQVIKRKSLSTYLDYFFS